MGEPVPGMLSVHGLRGWAPPAQPVPPFHAQWGQKENLLFKLIFSFLVFFFLLFYLPRPPPPPLLCDMQRSVETEAG